MIDNIQECANVQKNAGQLPQNCTHFILPFFACHEFLVINNKNMSQEEERFFI